MFGQSHHDIKSEVRIEMSPCWKIQCCIFKIKQTRSKLFDNISWQFSETHRWMLRMFANWKKLSPSYLYRTNTHTPLLFLKDYAKRLLTHQDWLNSNFSHHWMLFSLFIIKWDVLFGPLQFNHLTFSCTLFIKELSVEIKFLMYWS